MMMTVLIGPLVQSCKASGMVSPMRQTGTRSILRQEPGETVPRAFVGYHVRCTGYPVAWWQPVGLQEMNGAGVVAR